ncbi:MAG: hypothetical protein OXH38_08310, partial [Chloroflexi bacterium]|nr:hypothetical protein [Chloroflexota bacterium]
MARLYMFIMGASMGILMPLYSLLMQNSLPFRLLGVGTATNQFFRQMGAAMGISLFGAMIVSGFSSQLSKAFPDGFERLKEQPEILLNPEALQGFRQQLEQQSPGSADAVIQAAREALAVPVTDVFLYGAILMAAVLAIAVVLPRVRFQTQEEMMAETRAMAAANRPRGGTSTAAPVPASRGGPPSGVFGGDRSGAPPSGAAIGSPNSGRLPSHYSGSAGTAVAEGPTVGTRPEIASPAEASANGGRGNGLHESVPMIASWATQRRRHPDSA